MRVFPFIPPALAALGPPLAAWGGYGLGVGAVGPLWTGSNLLAAGLIAGGGLAGLAAAALGRTGARRPAASRSFAADAAALEVFAPAVVRHPRGAAALKALAELLFEVHHPADAAAAPAAVPSDGTEGGAE
ncbi:hypothetical protein [Alienimonas sp. DA493]|uniref:hypothetical protein n=1 Tax=Alienimonas sp. DA493 TaxID=3373605 RepID=UPI0037553A15